MPSAPYVRSEMGRPSTTCSAHRHDGRRHGSLVRRHVVSIIVCLQPEIAQGRLIVRATAERPMVFAVALLVWNVVDAGNTKPHPAMLIEFPVLVAITAEPMPAIVMPLLGEAYSLAVLADRPDFL